MMIENCWSLVTSPIPWSPTAQHQVGRQSLLGLLEMMGEITIRSDTSDLINQNLLPNDHVRILPSAGQTRRRPWLFFGDGKPLRRYLSVAHLPNAVLVAAASRRIGVDVVDLRNEPRSSFTSHWFNVAEVDRLASTPIQLAWAAKEATYKAICRRQPFRPRLLTITSVSHIKPDAVSVMVVSQAILNKTTRAAIVTILIRGPFAIALATVPSHKNNPSDSIISPVQTSTVCETTLPMGYREYSVTSTDLPAGQSQAATSSTRQSD